MGVGAVDMHQGQTLVACLAGGNECSCKTQQSALLPRVCRDQCERHLLEYWGWGCVRSAQVARVLFAIGPLYTCLKVSNFDAIISTRCVATALCFVKYVAMLAACGTAIAHRYINFAWCSSRSYTFLALVPL